ncbi:hypothetical protein RJ640_010738 [Escallonia rubra]|uniref:Rad21/Rec8-like protein N-terminal domain-containing protein n=1 Tax=Escallonia rubra TaxID=112253 RepID=A0AA88RIK0_9ASTE|nr:hypothetical protein RJ640_010738 [Escallonia rubra]
MFYSRQLLARKGPLGQIWMAATMHAKIYRKDLDKLNIIKICEEILNPSVPMALRLSGILMGGVVIVYERKVKLLYDDVTRLLVEINQAWKVKSVRDPTVFPKGKSQAKYESVTLPDNQEAELGETEQSFSTSHTVMGFQQTAYIAMRLDTVDEPYISHNAREGELSQGYHQADAANITLFEHIDSHQPDKDIYNRFERFDIEGDEETQVNGASQDYTQLRSTTIPSPPLQEEYKRSAEIQEQHPDDYVNLQINESKEASQRLDAMSTMKIAKLMDVPPVHFEDVRGAVTSQSSGISIEKLRANLNNHEMPLVEEVRTKLMNTNGVGLTDANGPNVAEPNQMVTPSNSEANKGRSNQKRAFSSSRHDGSGLEPVVEETSWERNDETFKLARLSENGLPHENDFAHTGLGGDMERKITQTKHRKLLQKGFRPCLKMNQKDSESRNEAVNMAGLSPPQKQSSTPEILLRVPYVLGKLFLATLRECCASKWSPLVLPLDLKVFINNRQIAKAEILQPNSGDVYKQKPNLHIQLYSLRVHNRLRVIPMPTQTQKCSQAHVTIKPNTSNVLPKKVQSSGRISEAENTIDEDYIDGSLTSKDSIVLREEDGRTMDSDYHVSDDEDVKLRAIQVGDLTNAVDAEHDFDCAPNEVEVDSSYEEEGTPNMKKKA